MKHLREHKKYLIIITLISIIVMLILGFDTKKLGHDMGFHVTNIENLAEELDPLHFKFTAPLISENIADNLGYGLYIFYPALPHLTYAYVYKFLSIFNIDVLTSILIVNILVTILSAIFLYLLAYKLSKNKNAALFASILFILFPYRLSSIFIRYSLNENFMTLFIPLILISLLYLKEHNYKRFYLFFIIGYIGILNSHLMMSMYFTLFLIPFLIIYRKEIFNKETIKASLKAILVVSIFVLPQIILMYAHKDKYYLIFSDNYMNSPNYILDSLLSLKNYFFIDHDDWNCQFYIPIIIIITFIISLYYIFKNKEKEKKFYIFSVLEIILLFIFMSPLIPWEKMPGFLRMIQFSWRVEIFLMYYLIIISMYLITKIKFKYLTIILIVGSILLTIPLGIHIVNREYEATKDVFILDRATGNVHEYYPIEYILAKDFYKTRGDKIISFDDKIKVDVIKEDFPNITFKVSGSENSNIEIPRLYYLGYKLHINGKPYEVTRSGVGLLQLNNAPNGLYELEYKGTLLYQIFNGIKYIFIVLFISYFIHKKYKLKKINHS